VTIVLSLKLQFGIECQPTLKSTRGWSFGSKFWENGVDRCKPIFNVRNYVTEAMNDGVL